MTEIEMFLDSLKASIESYSYLSEQEKRIINDDMKYYKSLCMFEQVVDHYVKEQQEKELTEKTEKKREKR